MFTFSLLYVFFYLFIILSLLVLAISQVPLYIVTQWSMTNFSIFLQKYVPSKNLFLFLVFSLTGLPPVGLFFIKFNIFVFLLYQAHIFIIITLFLMFFLNMLYYVQFFNFKNSKKTMYHVVTPTILKVWQNNVVYNKNFSSYNTYFLTLFVVNTLVFVFLSIIMFSDYFLIVSVFLKCQQ